MKRIILLFLLAAFSTPGLADNMRLARYYTYHYNYAANTISASNMEAYGHGEAVVTLADKDYFFIFSISYPTLDGSGRESKASLENVAAFKNGERLAADAVKINGADLSDWNNFKVKFVCDGQNYGISQPLEPLPAAGSPELQKYAAGLREFKQYAVKNLKINYNSN